MTVVQSILQRQLKTALIVFNILWTLLFAGLIWRVIVLEKEEVVSLATKEAKASHDKDVIYRQWVAQHGGVYVRTDETSPPNPYLKHLPERDIVTPSGKKLTLVNPAYMTRQIHEMVGREYGIKGHITSLNPIRPENKADEWETMALKEFEKGQKSISSIMEMEGEPYLRYMERFEVKEGCLLCHAAQGYKIGDIRGGISTSVPLTKYYAISWAHNIKYGSVLGFIWLLGAFLFNFSGSILSRNIKIKDLVEQELRLSEQRFELAEKGSFFGLWDWPDVNSDEEWWSDQWYALLGYNKGEMKASCANFKSLLHPEDLSLVEEAIKRHFEERIPFDMRYRLKAKSGNYRWIRTRGQCMWDDAGRPVRMSGSIEDITEHVEMEIEKQHLEKQLFQASKMEAIGTIAGGIAHDFNNILSIIITANEMVLDEGQDEDNTYYLGLALQAAFRARELVKQILAFSRLTQKELLPVLPHLLIKEDLKLIRSTIPATVILREKILLREGYIKADPTQLHQILINLCTNAVHAMDEKGELVVSLTETILQPEDISHKPELRTGRYVQLSVQDTGCGMSQETLEKIFIPFFTTKVVGKGTGMGLSVVHGIVEDHGGLVKVESVPGEGSTFHVYFPLIEGGSEYDDESGRQLQKGCERILLVDDEEMLAESQGAMLRRLGYQVNVKVRGADALQLFKENPDHFDLLITDQTMPVISGMELAAEVMRIRPDIPIIICTGYSSKFSEQQAREMGVHIVYKPLDKAGLAEAVRMAFQ